MNKAVKTIYWLFVLWSVLLAALNLTASITFGHGLGDIYYLLFLLFFVLVISIITFKIIRHPRNRNAAIFLLLFVLAIMLAFTLKLTVYRGPEYRWDGQLFLN